MKSGRERPDSWLDAAAWMFDASAEDGPAVRIRGGRSATRPDAPEAGAASDGALCLSHAAPKGDAESITVVGLRLRSGTFGVASPGVSAKQLATALGPHSTTFGAPASAVTTLLVDLSACALLTTARRAVVCPRTASALYRGVRSLATTFIATSARDGRTHVRCFDDDGALCAIAKVVPRADEKGTIAREASFLRDGRTREHLGDSVPVVLGEGRDAASAWLMTRGAPGRPAPASFTPVVQDWLRRLLIPGRTASLADLGIVRRDLARCEISEQRAWAHAGHVVATLVREVRGPSAILHGDFVPWNVVVTSQGPKVFDWETNHFDGIAGWDRAFYVLQVGIVKFTWSAQEIFERSEILIGELAEDGYDTASARALVSAVLLHCALTHLDDGSTARARTAREALLHLAASTIG